jgi:hypothetical protein
MGQRGNGLGVPQDKVRAYMWLNLSAAQGREGAAAYVLPIGKAGNRASIHFTAVINALSASSDGQQQPSTPSFGFGASSSMSMSNGQPVIGAPVNKSVSVIADVPVKISVSALFLTTTEGKKISVFVGFGRGTGRANASILVALSDAFAADVVEGRLLSGWSSQHRLEPCK